MARRVKVDMTGVESYTRCPEGEWLARLSSIEEGTVQGSGDDCLKARFEVIKGSAKGCAVFETFSLTEKALWKLKSFLEAAGMKANGKLSLDLDKLEGKVCIIDVIHDEYNGQKRAKIASYLKAEDDEEDIDDDEDEMEEEDETPRKPVKKAPAKPVKKSKPVEDDDEEDDEEEEEEEPAPKKKPVKKAAPAKKAPAKSKKVVEEDDEDDDDDWEDDED